MSNTTLNTIDSGHTAWILVSMALVLLVRTLRSGFVFCQIFSQENGLPFFSNKKSRMTPGLAFCKFDRGTFVQETGVLF
jgi:hypothetical protein